MLSRNTPLRVRRFCIVISALVFSLYAINLAATKAIDQKQVATTPDIGTFMQIGGASLSAVTWEGDDIFFVSAMSGKSQVYRHMGDEWPWQLSLFKDGISGFYLSWNGKWAVISAADGGSEQTQLYLMNLSDASVDTLTRFEKVQTTSVVWSRDDKTIYFRSNHETADNFQVYAMDLETRAITPVFDRPSYDDPGFMSVDGKKMFMYNTRSNTITDIYLLDRTTLQAEKVTPAGDFVNYNAVLMPDGKSIWLLSNNNDNGNVRLARMTVGDTSLTFVDDWVDKKWSLDDLGFSQDFKYMYVIVNEEGYSRVHIREVASGKDMPEPPLAGMTGSPEFDMNGNIYFSFSGPTYTSDAWKFNLLTKDLQKLTHSSYAGVDRTTFREPQLVKFKSFDGLEVPAFLYLPPNHKKGDRIPFIIDAHGGPESQTRPSFVRSYQYFMLNGYGILAVNPRGSSGYGKAYLDLDNYKLRQNSLKDYKAAAEWLLSSGYSEKGRMGIMGGSYGGYVTLGMITEYPDLFNAAIDNVGISNFVTFLTNTAPYRRAVREAEYGPLSDSSFLLSISPMLKADRIRTPLLVIHGANDPRVPVSEARQILAAVTSNGAAVDSLIFTDDGHGASGRVNIIRQYRKMVSFLDEHLKYQLSKTGASATENLK